MNIKEFYDKIGSDYNEVLGRLNSESLIIRLVKKFSADPTFGDLTDGFEKNDAEKAFRAAHTLKGLCSNLGFDCLFRPAYDLTEKLRGRTFDVAETTESYNEVKKQYAFITESIKELD